MEPFLNQLFSQQYTTCKGKESESGIASVGRCDEEHNNGKVKASSSTNASGTQGNSLETKNKEGMAKNKFTKSIWRKKEAQHKHK